MCNGYFLYVFVALLFHNSIDLLTYNWYFLPQLWNTSDTSEELHVYIYIHMYTYYILPPLPPLTIYISQNDHFLCFIHMIQYTIYMYNIDIYVIVPYILLSILNVYIYIGR